MVQGSGSFCYHKLLSVLPLDLPAQDPPLSYDRCFFPLWFLCGTPLLSGPGSLGTVNLSSLVSCVLAHHVLRDLSDLTRWDCQTLETDGERSPLSGWDLPRHPDSETGFRPISDLTQFNLFLTSNGERGRNETVVDRHIGTYSMNWRDSTSKE